MYKVIRGTKNSTGETPAQEIVRVVDQSKGEDVFEADADSFFVLNGTSYRLAEISDEDLVAELVRKGRLR
jgi:hypothetical protein